jgi:hygromycin-B 7''-O-kinase
MLLHRASDPVRHICIEGWQDKADTLADLERLLWPVR